MRRIHVHTDHRSEGIEINIFAEELRKSHRSVEIDILETGRNRHSRTAEIDTYWGVAMIGRLLKIIGLFCGIYSLFVGSFTFETYHFEEPTNRSQPMCRNRHVSRNRHKCGHGNTRRNRDMSRNRHSRDGHSWK